MVGPHMPWPMMNTPQSLPNGPSSCCQITRSIGDEPRPPYSLGQCRQAQPASAFFFCQAFATSRMLAFFSAVRPSEDLRSSSSYCFGALAEIHAFGLGAERGFLRGVVEVHVRPSSPSVRRSGLSAGVDLAILVCVS